MKLFDTLAEMGHEEIVMCSDPSVGYKGILAVHSTRLGPALGGTRFWQYATDEEAITDALRLSRGMTYKNAVAGLHLGGGKSIIIGDNKTKDREKIFRAHGRFVESLGGRYITAEDVGTSTKDMDYVHMETGHVAGLAGKSGDPSPVTAHGVFRAVQASANRMWGSDSLEGKPSPYRDAAASEPTSPRSCTRPVRKLIVSDIDAAKAARVSKTDGRQRSSRETRSFPPMPTSSRRARWAESSTTRPSRSSRFTSWRAARTISCSRSVTATSSQRRGILYAPDYVANAGGVINVYGEVAGWDAQRALDKADDIYDTILKVFEIADAQHIPTYEAADRLAEQRLAAAT